MKNREDIIYYYGDRTSYVEFQKLISYISEKHGFN